MTLDELRRVADQFATDRTFREIVGRPLIREMRVANRDQIAALGEHIERAAAGTAPTFASIPIYLDSDIPLGMAVVVFEDDTTKSFRLT